MVRQFTKSLHGVIDGLVLVGFAEGFVMGVAFAITGVPNATILGALTIIAGMIPLGATLIFTGGALFLCQQDHLMMAFGLMVCGLLTTTIVDHIVRPILIGNATKLHFILVLFGVLGGFETMGLLGLFIGPTIMSAVVFLWRNWLESPVIPQE